MVDEVPRVFVSHRFGDLKRAQAIALALHEQGVDVWFDGWNVVGGDNFVQSMEAALAWSTVGVVLISRSGVGEGWMRAEVSKLIHRAVAKKHRIIPVRLDPDVEVPGFLAELHPVDLASGDMTDLLRALFQHRGPPGSTPLPNVTVPVRDEIYVAVHADASETLAELRPHLALLQRRGKLHIWDPSTVTQEEVLTDARVAARRRAKKAIVLVSAGLLADSDFEAEIVALLTAGVPLFCLYVEPTIVAQVDFIYRDLKTGQERTRFLTDFKGVNDPERPLKSLPKHARDSVYVDLAKALMR